MKKYFSFLFKFSLSLYPEMCAVIILLFMIFLGYLFTSFKLTSSVVSHSTSMEKIFSVCINSAIKYFVPLVCLNLFFVFLHYKNVSVTSVCLLNFICLARVSPSFFKSNSRYRQLCIAVIIITQIVFISEGFKPFQINIPPPPPPAAK